jgi:hypothetical protein
MDPLNFLKTFLKLEGNVQPTINKFLPGQIIVGKVIRFFPNQMAEIQIGSQKLIAKLEIPLTANQQYWFQVQSGEGKIRLKMIKQDSNHIGYSNDQQTSIIPKESLEENQGLIEQFVTQIPILVGNSSSDLTIQWNGRKKKDGKLDSNFCRVLLYLNLENIGDTFVDLHIQNRIMSISIENEKTDLRLVVAPLIHTLKEKLSEMNYHLTSLTFEQSSKMNKVKKGIPSFGSTPYEGVDIRI